MQFPNESSTAPQFETAEYVAPAGVDACAYCNQSISSYYRVNGSMACTTCAERIRDERPKDSHSAFSRGLMFGIGGAILGLALYAFVGIVTGLMIGFVSLAVGYIVAQAMMMGSRGIGGRRYQIAAVLLTYAAVSMASIPIWIAHYVKEGPAAKQAQVQQAPESSSQPDTAQQPEPERKSRGMLAAFGFLALIGLASPFLELQSPVNGLIGLVILWVGIQIAWRRTAGLPAVTIDGPF